MRSGEPARGLEQVLEAFACGDPPDVENDRGVAGKAEARTEVAVRLRARRLGKSVAPHTYLLGRDARGNESVGLSLRGDHHGGSSSGDSSIQRRVERPLQQHFPQARFEIRERLEAVSD